ncbi:ornithine cyclodeaminase [Bosea sp. Root381]|uniref:ornithine cyclodeaminase family protein n=1 Tax=Bosea sp. Root381 TaxID=1736524 RepID=UPI0006F259E3|nr:ornithine cyclodeaminase family protein [Bosea sp. Root381]KRE07986.1 ornithine cyclodeaminase [Bosea sp. Root381]
MLVLDAAATERGLSMAELVQALREAFATPATVPLRHAHKIESEGYEGTSLIMPAWSMDGFYGVKIINIFPRNAERGLPGLHGIYALFDARTGVPLAFLDADVLTAYRTAAASALAASYLAAKEARRLLVVGAGRVARLLPAAMAVVRPIDEVRIWSRTGASAARLAAELSASGHETAVVADLEAGVRAADIVSCATLSTVALVEGSWLAPGTHLDLIGSFTPAMREADGACFQRGSVFVDTDEAQAKAGDILSAIAEGSLQPKDIRANLTELVAGSHQGRRDSDEITVFKAVGSALEDLAAARLVYQHHISSSGS